MVIHGNTWQYMAIRRYTWQYMAIHGITWLYMAIHSSTWLSKPQLKDYAFPPSPQSQLFDYYPQFCDDEPVLGPLLGHPSPSERKQPLLDKELELVKQEKEKLALELEVLHLRRVLGPAMSPTTSAAPCATGKSDTGLCSRYINKS